MTAQSQRALVALEALADTDDPAFEFTGRRFTIAQLLTHTRSESALHRWDIVGDDDISAFGSPATARPLEMPS